MKRVFALGNGESRLQLDLEKLRNKLFGIECNFEELNGIDFKKGCYIGQENTSRIKLRNKLSKRLLSIQLIEGKLIEGSPIKNNDNEIGKVLINNQYPFAIVKYLSDFITFSCDFIYSCGVIKKLFSNMSRGVIFM
mgnify:CR=1 FL=1